MSLHLNSHLKLFKDPHKHFPLTPQLLADVEYAALHSLTVAEIEHTRNVGRFMVCLGVPEKFTPIPVCKMPNGKLNESKTTFDSIMLKFLSPIKPTLPEIENALA